MQDTAKELSTAIREQVLAKLLDIKDPESAVAQAIADIETIQTTLSDLKHFYEHNYTRAHSLKAYDVVRMLASKCQAVSDWIGVVKGTAEFEDRVAELEGA